MNKQLLGVMVLVVLLCGLSQANKIWYTCPPISGGTISSPVGNGAYLCGASVDFTCSRGSDTDYWRDTETQEEDWPEDAMSENYPLWTATAGSWKDGDCWGTSVEWIAPESPASGITICLYENDLPYLIPGGDDGSRNDSITLQDTTTGVQAVLPVLDQVDYEGGNHAIYDVTVPEYSRSGSHNDPASWSFGVDAVAKAKFWHSLNLSQAESGVKVRAETSGDGFNIGDWGDSSTATWGTSWPTSEITCVSEMTIDSDIQYQDYSAQWRYKCTNGTNGWIDTTDQTGCRLYVVYGSPVCSSGDYTKSHLEKATKYGEGGGSSKSNVCTTLQSYLHSNLNFEAGTGPTGKNGVWNIIEPGGSGNAGDCVAHANLMKVCLEVLGIDAAYAYVADATNQPSESDVVWQEYWCVTYGRYEHNHFREQSGGTIWNYEGVCGVDSTYYDVAWSTTSGTYSYCKTAGNGIVYEWIYSYLSGGTAYSCPNQGGTHIPQ
jgi:hypothetical protein